MLGTGYMTIHQRGSIFCAVRIVILKNVRHLIMSYTRFIPAMKL